MHARVPALLGATQTGDSAKGGLAFFDVERPFFDVAPAHAAGAKRGTEAWSESEHKAACSESEQPSATAAPNGFRV